MDDDKPPRHRKEQRETKHAESAEIRQRGGSGRSAAAPENLGFRQARAIWQSATSRWLVRWVGGFRGIAISETKMGYCGDGLTKNLGGGRDTQLFFGTISDSAFLKNYLKSLGRRKYPPVSCLTMTIPKNTIEFRQLAGGNCVLHAPEILPTPPPHNEVGAPSNPTYRRANFTFFPILSARSTYLARHWISRKLDISPPWRCAIR